MLAFCILLLNFFFFWGSVAQPTVNSPSPTSTNPAGPSVSSCHGPQRYRLEAYISSNKTHIGHLIAELADGDIFGLLIAKKYPDNQIYFSDWQFSAAPQDHGDTYLYIPPGQEGVDPDAYYLAFTDVSNPYVTLYSRSVIDNKYDFLFSGSVNSKTHVATFTFPGYKKPHTFAVTPDVISEKPVYSIQYPQTDNVPSGSAAIYFKAIKSC